MTTINPKTRPVNSRKNRTENAQPKRTEREDKEKLPLNLAENLLTLIAHNNEHGRTIVNMIKPYMFENEVHRTLAVRIFDYWKKWKRAPGKIHTPDLVADILEDPDNPRAAAYRSVLVGMVATTDEGINTDYVLDRVKTFLRLQSLKKTILESAELIESRQHLAIEEVEGKWNKHLHVEFDKHPQKKSAGIITARTLETMTYRPKKCVVPDVLVEGVTIFAGKPKIGKSWLMLGVAVAVSVGGDTLGGIHCKQGDVLYCALEDNERRLQSRLRKMGIERWSKYLQFLCEMPRLDEGGLDLIRDWVKEAKRPRLVIIDTLKRVRSHRLIKGQNESQYDIDYDSIAQLQTLASECGIAMVLVHHQRKMDAEDPFDTISGTFGLTGAADSIVILQRESGGFILRARGRDITELEKAVVFSKETCHWKITGEAEQVRRSQERVAITQAMRELNEPASTQKIAQHAGCKPANVSKLLVKMAREGVVHPHGYGKYDLEPPEEGVSSTSDRPADRPGRGLDRSN
jgi:hypothetical protein